MKFVHKYVAYLLIVVLPLSSWASTEVPCAQIAGTKTAIETAMANTHADHHATASAANESADVSPRHAAHYAAAGGNPDSGAAECPCCDDCETACVVSTCSPVALTTPSLPIAFGGADKHLPSADAFRNGPPPHVLFRPPILSV